MSLEILHRYCCRDSAVTHEINSKLDKWLDTKQREHYAFNMTLLNPLLYMELRGIRYDVAGARQRLQDTLVHVNTVQHELNVATNHCFSPTLTKGDILKLVQSAICYKRDPNQAKKNHEDDFRWAQSVLMSLAPLDKASLGRLETITKIGLNIKSDEFKIFLYTTLGLPEQKHPVTHELTTNYEALLKLTKKSDHPALPLAIDLGELRTRSQMLEISADPDGRVRCGYNIVGTETGRIACYTSPSGSGYNLQTIPAENQLKPVGHPLRAGMRDLFIADEGCYMFQCDLSGADGWTIGARMAALGETTMLEDLKAGLKPARIVCYMLRHGDGAIRGKSREEIANVIKEVKKEDWDYFACKQGIWGTCYLMGARKLSNVILLQSEGKVNMSESETKDFQRLVFLRYPVNRIWHPAMQRFLAKQPYPPKLTAASGHTRKFFGRSNEILGDALAHEPQANTTYATNMAAHKLWVDPENRIGKKLRVEPLHQVHDALIGQFKIEDTAWAINKIKQWFDNPLMIAGISITIPFEGTYGLNWSFENEAKKGSI